MKKIVVVFLLTLGVMMAQGYWAEPVKLPPVINDTVEFDSLWHRYYAHISPDGTELYYTLSNSPYDDDIYVARYDKETDVWDSVTRLSINMPDVRRELSPSITADHSRIYWVSWGREGSYGGYDVWYAEWDGEAGDWGEPQNCGPNVNTPGYEFTCFIAPDGKTLYNSSTYDSDGEDIYKHEWVDDTGWGPRLQVFEEMHPGGDEYDPWVSADGRWLYFSRIAYVPHGRSIYRSRWQGEYFGEPEWVGEPVGLPEGVTGRYQFNDGPSLNSEGSRIYFASNRPDSNFQWQYLWYADYLDAVEESEPDLRYELSVSAITSKEYSITYALTQTNQVFCAVYDTAGNLVRILTSEVQTQGNHTLVWDGLDSRNREVPNGMYFIRMTVGRQHVVKRAILLN